MPSNSKLISLIPNANTLSFKTGTTPTERLHIQDNGYINILNDVKIGGAAGHTPSDLLHLESASNPAIRLNESADPDSYTLLQFSANTQTVFSHYTSLGEGSPIIDINPIATDNVAQYIRLFRASNSSGTATFQIKDPGGTNNQHQLGSSTLNSYLCAQGGDLGIGNTAPAAKLHVTNAGTGDSLRIDDAGTDATPFIIDVNGRMVQGHTEYLLNGSAATFEQHSTSNYSTVGAPNIAIANWSTNAAFAGGLAFHRSLSGIVGNETTVNNNTELGSIYWLATDGSGFLQAAEIIGEMDANPAGLGADMPGRLIFSTTAVGDTTPTERMRITSDGFVGINTTSPIAPLGILATDSVANATYYAMNIDMNSSGADAVSGGNKTHTGLRIDLDSSATGGTTTDTEEHQVYGALLDIDVTGDSDLIRGYYTSTRSTLSSGTTTNLRGVDSQVEADPASGGTVSNAYGGYFYGLYGGVGTVNNLFGSYNRAEKQADSGTSVLPNAYGAFNFVYNSADTPGADSTITSAYGSVNEVQVIGTHAQGVAVTNAQGVRSSIDVDTNRAGVITTGFLFRGDYQLANASGVTNPWGIYLTGSTDNYIEGDMVFSDSVGIGLSVGSLPLAPLEVYNPSLGTTAGDVKELLTLRTTSGNQQRLEFFALRDANGTGWETAGTRIQSRIDSTYQSWIEFNGTAGDHAISFGAGNDGGATDPQAVSERMRIKSDGNINILNDVKIGGAGGDIPSAALEVVGDIFPGADSTYNLGSSSGPLAWASIHGDQLRINYDGTANKYDNAIIGGSADTNQTLIGHWNSSSTDILGLLPGITSNFGTIISGASAGHMVFALRDNDVNDSLAIISGGGNWSADTTYDTLIAQFRADGSTHLQDTLPQADSTYDLGSNTVRWGNLYVDDITKTSTTLVTNLNADLLDGYHGSSYVREKMGRVDTVFSSADWNDYTATGIYTVSDWQNNAATNGPILTWSNGKRTAYSWGVLKVSRFDLSGATYILQEYWPHAADGVFSRVYWTNWTAWQEIFSSRGSITTQNGLNLLSNDKLHTISDTQYIGPANAQGLPGNFGGFGYHRIYLGKFYYGEHKIHFANAGWGGYQSFSVELSIRYSNNASFTYFVDPYPTIGLGKTYSNQSMAEMKGFWAYVSSNNGSTPLNDAADIWIYYETSGTQPNTNYQRLTWWVESWGGTSRPYIAPFDTSTQLGVPMIAVSSVVGDNNGTTALVTTSSNHGFSGGEDVTIAGDIKYFGGSHYGITYVNATQFRISVSDRSNLSETGLSNVYVYEQPAFVNADRLESSLYIFDDVVGTTTTAPTPGYVNIPRLKVGNVDTSTGQGQAPVSALEVDGTITATNIVLDNAGTQTTGTASSDALDWYEEGTWTPTIIGSTTNPSSITYTQNKAKYTRIGDIVHFTCSISASISGGSGDLYVDNFPFVASNAVLIRDSDSTNLWHACTMGYASTTPTASGGSSPVSCMVRSNDNYMAFYDVNNVTVQMKTSINWYFAGSYSV